MAINGVVTGATWNDTQGKVGGAYNLTALMTM
jgi:hypothetical protein